MHILFIPKFWSILWKFFQYNWFCQKLVRNNDLWLGILWLVDLSQVVSFNYLNLLLIIMQYDMIMYVNYCGVDGCNTNRLMNCCHLHVQQIVRCKLCGLHQVMPRRKHFSWVIFSMHMGRSHAFLL